MFFFVWYGAVIRLVSRYFLSEVLSFLSTSFPGSSLFLQEKVLSRGKKREGPGYKVVLPLCVFTVWFLTAHKVTKKRHYLPLSETWIIITEGQKLISHLKIEIS